MNLCSVVFPLQIGSGLFAALAAILWFYASSIKTPSAITTIVVSDVGIHGELDELAKALILQDKWNARAAFCGHFCGRTSRKCVHADMLGWMVSTVARMNEAIPGIRSNCFPGFRFAHPGYGLTVAASPTRFVRYAQRA
jgi:hypothetical protein